MNEFKLKIAAMSALAVLLAVAIAYTNILLLGAQQTTSRQIEALAPTTVEKVVTSMSTETITATLTTTETFKVVETSMEASKAISTSPPRLGVSEAPSVSPQITLSKTQIEVGETENLIVKLINLRLNMTGPIVGRIEGHVTSMSTGEEVLFFSGTTDSNGFFEISWRIGDNFRPDIYSVNLSAYSLDNVMWGSSSAEFEVLGECACGG